jgi:hypothetical protein
MLEVTDNANAEALRCEVPAKRAAREHGATRIGGRSFGSLGRTIHLALGRLQRGPAARAHSA